MKAGEGSMVSYKGNMYWVYDVKGERLTLVPQDAMDWETGELKLGQAFQVDQSRVSVVEPAG